MAVEQHVLFSCCSALRAATTAGPGRSDSLPSLHLYGMDVYLYKYGYNVNGKWHATYNTMLNVICIQQCQRYSKCI